MSILRFFFKAEGLKELKARLRKLKKGFTKGFTPIRRSLVVQLLKMSDAKLAQSARGTLPRGWEPLSPVTVFVRTHRSKRKNTRPQVGVDTGVMRLSTRPFDRGNNFGIENLISRASLFNFGGISKGGSVGIGRFTRKTPSGGQTTVRPYTMKFRGGHRVPARPFFPTPREFIPMLKKILKDYEKKLARRK